MISSSSPSGRTHAGQAITLVLCLINLSGCGLFVPQEVPESSDVGTQPVVNPASGLLEFRDCDVCPLLVLLPPGRYLMGAPDGEEARAGNGNRPEASIAVELPQVEMVLHRPFAFGKYEVVFDEWNHCVATGGCLHEPDNQWWGERTRPVINIARADVDPFLRWLSRTSGRPYRLPSEAEWEYAARAGSRTARHWGEEIGSGMAVCDGCGTRWDNRRTAPVGSFPPNSFGLYDTLGNVYEWVADCWTENLEDLPRDGTPLLADSFWWRDGSCERSVRRGGYYNAYPWVVRAAARSFWSPGPWKSRSRFYGFRVARSYDPDTDTPIAEAIARDPALASVYAPLPTALR